MQIIDQYDTILFSFLRSSIVERMPVLISSQTSNANHTGQQEQIDNQEENSSIDGRTTHVSSAEPVVNK